MSRENKINYEELEGIVVTSQSELDMIPDGFKGRIYIESGIVRLTRVFPRRVDPCRKTLHSYLPEDWKEWRDLYVRSVSG